MRSILIIDGEQEFRDSLREHLKKEGYKVYCSDRAKPGLEKAREKNPDLIITELAFSDSGDFETIKEIKSDFKLSNIPIVVLSQRNDDFEKVLAFELGADDYIVKTACFREISARLKAQFRYPRGTAEAVDNGGDRILRYGDIVINLNEGDVRVNGEHIVFSSKEFKLLTLFLENRGKIVKKEFILNRVWGNEARVASGLLNVYIGNIKRKVVKKSLYHFSIQAVGRTGYKIEVGEKDSAAM